MSDPMQGAFGQYKPTVEQSEAHAALRDRIATLERQLAEVTAERDDRDSLRTALRQVAEAGDVMSMLFEAHWTVKDTDEGVHAAVENWKKALALPVVQAVLKGGEHKSG